VTVTIVPTTTKEFLQVRDYKVDLTANVGRMQVVNATVGAAGPGFYCKVCDCVVKDSINYLDHINGKRRTWQESFGPSVIGF